MRLIKRHWGFLLGILFVCAVAYADSVGTFDALKLRPGTLPAAGKDGELRVDSADSNKLKKYNESTTSWEEITGGGGGSGINYYADFQADTISNVTTFDDGGTLTDGTGGTVDYMSVTSETTVPLSGDASYKLVKGAANASGEGFSFDTGTPDITSTQGGETVYLTFNYLTASDYDNSSSGNQAKVYVYKTGNNTLEACNTRNVLSGTFTNELPVAPNGGQYQCAMTLTTGDTAVRVIIWWTGTGTNSTSILVDKVKVAPDSVVTAPIFSEVQTYTPTFTGFGTVSGIDAQYWREGQFLVFNVAFTSGTTTGVIAEMDLPDGLTVDSSYTNRAIGRWYINTGTATSRRGGLVQLNSSYTNSVIFGNSHYDIATSPFTALLGSDFASSTYISLYGRVKITEWGNSNAILSTTQADHQTIKVAAAAQAGESLTADTTDINFEVENCSTCQDSHNAWDGDQFTAPESGTYDVEGLFRATASGTRALSLYVDGTLTKTVSSNAYTGLLSKFSGSIYLDKGEVLSLRSDLTETQATGIQSNNWITIESRPDFSTFSTYGPYEYQEVALSADTNFTNSGYTDVTGASLTLTPGTYEIGFNIYCFFDWSTGSSIGSTATLAITDSSNVAITNGYSYRYHILNNNDDQISTMISKKTELTITETETFKVRGYQNVSPSNVQIYAYGTAGTGISHFWARRMK